MLNNIMVFPVGTFVTDSEAIAAPETIVTLRCNPSSSETTALWLDDTLPVPGPPTNLRLAPGSEGVYQCLGQISNLPETNLTGERGNNVYVLLQCKNLQKLLIMKVGMVA